MLARMKKPLGTTMAAVGVLVASSCWGTVRGDEPGFLGRLFRPGGGNSAPSDPSRTPQPQPYPRPDLGAPPPRTMAQPPSPSVPAPSLLPPGSGSTAGTFGGPTSAPPEFASTGGSGAIQRIRPQPRVSRSATDADPIVTRIALGRADDGNQFGMILQVYADGTVIDSEGVHRLGPEAIRPLMGLLQGGELGRVNGHCGGPPADFIEQNYVVVYERRLGGLRANSFSYSGNTEGCSAPIRQLQQALEQLQGRISNPNGTPEPIATPTATALPGLDSSTPPLIPPGTTGADSIPLTPAIP